MTRPIACPDPRATAPQWQPYVAAGETPAERVRRLAHVRTVFALRAAARARAA